MPHQNCSPDESILLVADASAWINLAATQLMAQTVQATGARMVITQTALNELEQGRSKGRTTIDQVQRLLESGLIEVMNFSHDDSDAFFNLISGDAASTLDDGEAATLVCAARLNGVAVIDERKATTVASIRFPRLLVQTTVDLLLTPTVLLALGKEAVTEAIYNALLHARMRVPDHRLDEVAAMIGLERAAKCNSLPSVLRTGRVEGTKEA